MEDVQHIRKTVIWAVPVCLLGLVLVVVGFGMDFVDTVNDLRSLAPSIRLRPAIAVAPITILFMVLVLVFGVFKAIPSPIAASRSQYFMLRVLALNVVLMVVVLLFARPFQDSQMPKLGYTSCDLLQGNPTVWFQDWVRNPEWCVSGKSREWVAEQAARAKKK